MVDWSARARTDEINKRIHSVLSCSYLLIGSGNCIYRLMNYSYIHFSKVLPQFIFTSIGITAIGVRSLFGVIYNLFWRYYPIDPLLIEQELLNKKENKYLIDWSLYTIGLSSMVYALYLHHNYIITGSITVTLLILLEIITFIKDEFLKDPQDENQNDNFTIWTNTRFFISYLDPKYLSFAWIVITELFGLAMSNNYICAANAPYSLTMIVYRPFGLCQEWSIRNSMNDYMMLLYIILITEAVIQLPQ